MFIELLLLSYAGILVHYLFKLKEAADKNQFDTLFTRAAILKDVIGACLSIVCATTMVYIRQDISSIFVVTPAAAVMAGYSAQSMFNKIMGAKTPNIPTLPADKQ